MRQRTFLVDQNSDYWIEHIQGNNYWYVYLDDNFIGAYSTFKAAKQYIAKKTDRLYQDLIFSTDNVEV